MDDGYCYGRSEEVLPAICRFTDRLTALGLHLQFRKCSFYSPRTLPSAVRAELDALGIAEQARRLRDIHHAVDLLPERSPRIRKGVAQVRVRGEECARVASSATQRDARLYILGRG